MEFHLTATGRHLPYGITQCYSVTCHPTQVNAPRLCGLCGVSRYSNYLPRRDGRLSWPTLPGNAPDGNRTRNLSITSPTPYHYTNRATQDSCTVDCRDTLRSTQCQCAKDRQAAFSYFLAVKIFNTKYCLYFPDLTAFSSVDRIWNCQ